MCGLLWLVFRLYPITVRRAIAFFMSPRGDRKKPFVFNALRKAARKVSPSHDKSCDKFAAGRQVNLGKKAKALISLVFLGLAHRLQWRG
jgi:hypothetical protein